MKNLLAKVRLQKNCAHRAQQRPLLAGTDAPCIEATSLQKNGEPRQKKQEPRVGAD